MIRTSIKLLCLAAAALCANPPAPEARSPNVVYIMSDTHRWGAMSFTQTPAVQTPNLAQLAREGVSFNRRYVNLPICTPDRAIFLTGRWPYQQGLIANHMALAERVDLPEGGRHRGTLAWAFKNAGYTTALFGKWHLGGNIALPGVETSRTVQESRNALPFGFDRSVVWWGTNDHRQSTFSVDGGDAVEWEGASNATATVQQALEWISDVSGDERPFFAVISLNPPHGPFHDAPEAKQSLYPDEESLPFHPLDEVHHWESHRDYHALISGIDDDLGRIAKRLDELSLSQNTILIYTSDHGGMTGVNGIENYGQKRNPHDESTRVPFLVRWPGKIPPGVELDTLFSTIDVFPTLVALTGVDDALAAEETPEATASLDYVRSLAGFDLSHNILGELGAAEPDSVFLMHPTNMNNIGSGYQPIWRAVVTDDYTYAVTEDGEYALWNNGEEHQANNRVNDPETLEIRLMLWSKLRSWMDEAETPYVDNWFEKAPVWEIQAWNREHGLGESSDDRETGRRNLFDLSASKPN